MKILLADDHELIRKGLKEIISALNITWHISEVASLPAAMTALANDHEIELVLLDLYLPGATGIEGLIQLKQQFPGTAVVIISSAEAPDIVAAAMQSGASGYIPKSTSNEVMAKALDLVISGGVYIPPQALLNSVTPAVTTSPAEVFPLFDKLNHTQQRIAALLSAGLSNQEIAHETGFALQTIKNQVSNILRTTQLENRAALAAKLALRKIQ
ncbi:DNA-binding response regulator [Amphritea opalescens]|uniref:DNA-binding response regulator n=1 Tax=Amphritea opalescens TaxID=2490544 RepID=A0A430KPF8_9GAMM|nr:response regulator transcription factor [Amphritea opalescens]RTE65345.1 DNA-binding response regulator [Amphritea opalescens]